MHTADIGHGVALKAVAQFEINANRPGQRLERAPAIPWRERYNVITTAEPMNRLIQGVRLAGSNEIFMWK